jgi:starch synthase
VATSFQLVDSSKLEACSTKDSRGGSLAHILTVSRILTPPVVPLKILVLSSEVAPFAKIGGLADVCGSLPKALAALGHEVRVVMPAYRPIEEYQAAGRLGVKASSRALNVPLGKGLLPAGVFEATLPGSDVPIYFVAERNLFGGRDWHYGYWDDPYRFAFFSRAALDLAIAAMDWRPDVVHAHDWHAAPAVTWLATAGQLDHRYANLPTVFTIHNLMHQGNAPWGILDYLGVLSHSIREERFGEVNFMARGIFHATMINTVSPTYAKEIMTYEGGCGMDALLRHRHFDVHGILNGIDVDHWNPAADPHIAAPFSADSLERRILNKRALQRRAGLPERDDVPLVGMVTRLDFQKGLDITGHVLHLLMNNAAGDAQCVLLGSGAPSYEGMLGHLAGYHREKMTLVRGYDAELAQAIYAGCDIFLMPSLFEPCGLGQMIAMRYGAIPVVRGIGGLADTVKDRVNGFSFLGYNADEFWNKLGEAIDVYRHAPRVWRALQRAGMAGDYSWSTSAHRYQQLYQWAISRMRGW